MKTCSIPRLPAASRRRSRFGGGEPHHALFVGVLAGDLPPDAALTHDDDAVRELQHFGRSLDAIKHADPAAA